MAFSALPINPQDTITIDEQTIKDAKLQGYEICPFDL
jgi:hypothetical protein